MYVLFPKQPKLASQCILQCQVENQLSLPQPFCRLGGLKAYDEHKHIMFQVLDVSNIR